MICIYSQPLSLSVCDHVTYSLNLSSHCFIIIARTETGVFFPWCFCMFASNINDVSLPDRDHSVWLCNIRHCGLLNSWVFPASGRSERGCDGQRSAMVDRERDRHNTEGSDENMENCSLLIMCMVCVVTLALPTSHVSIPRNNLNFCLIRPYETTWISILKEWETESESMRDRENVLVHDEERTYNKEWECVRERLKAESQSREQKVDCVCWKGRLNNANSVSLLLWECERDE